MAYRRTSDGTAVSASVALDAYGQLRDGFAVSSPMLRPGEHIAFDLAFMDSAPAASVTLRDTAGKPTRLFDAASGATLQLTDHLIAAIETEARKEGLSVDRYVADVLRYSAAPTTSR